jgi:DNA-binding CsgD family transcriptional regulator
MAKTLVSLLSAAVRSERDDDFVEALLRAWAHVADADYHSLVRRCESTGTMQFWHPGEGRLGPDHRLEDLFSKLWFNKKPRERHPCVAAFLKNGPGAYLRSALEKDSLWKRRAHYRFLDKPQGIEDMISVFLTPSNGTLVMLQAGTRGPSFSPALVRLAGEFAAVANSLLIARGGFAHRPQTAASPNLTAREVEILNWVENGKRNTEIASILGLSPHTIRKHLENIFAKLGVETRTAAVAAIREATAGDQPARPGSNPIRQKNQKPA